MLELKPELLAPYIKCREPSQTVPALVVRLELAPSSSSLTFSAVVGTFERLHLFIGYKKGRMYSLTTLFCPVYEYEGKVDKNS